MDYLSNIANIVSLATLITYSGGGFFIRSIIANHMMWTGVYRQCVFRGLLSEQVMMDRAALRLILLGVFLISASSQQPVKKVRVNAQFKILKKRLVFCI